MDRTGLRGAHRPANGPALSRRAEPGIRAVVVFNIRCYRGQGTFFRCFFATGLILKKVRLPLIVAGMRRHGAPAAAPVSSDLPTVAATSIGRDGPQHPDRNGAHRTSLRVRG